MTIFFYEYCVCEVSAIFIVRRKTHRGSVTRREIQHDPREILDIGNLSSFFLMRANNLSRYSINECFRLF